MLGFQALSRAEAAEKRLQATEREGRRLRDQNETMLAELQVGAAGSFKPTALAMLKEAWG